MVCERRGFNSHWGLNKCPWLTLILAMALFDFLKEDPLEGLVPDDLEGLVEELEVDDSHADQDGDNTLVGEGDGASVY